jgi:hypothetical protein
MTTIEEHKEIIKEFLEDINEKIRAGLAADRQKIIGFTASEAAANLFALYLHSKNLLEPTFNINHRFFASLRIAEKKFDINFNKKEELIKLLVKQEEYRNKLCYGKKKNSEIVNSAISNLFEIKSIIDNELEVSDFKLEI